MEISRDNNAKISTDLANETLKQKRIEIRKREIRLNKLKDECIQKLTNDIVNKLADDSGTVSIVINNRFDNNAIIKRYNKEDFANDIKGAFYCDLESAYGRMSSYGLNFDSILTKKDDIVHEYKQSDIKENIMRMRLALEQITYFHRKGFDDFAEVLIDFVKNGESKDNLANLSLFHDVKQIIHLYEHLQESGIAGLRSIEKSFEKHSSLKKIFMQSLKEKYKDDKFITEVLSIEEEKKFLKDFFVEILENTDSEFADWDSCDTISKNIDGKFIFVTFPKQ